MEKNYSSLKDEELKKEFEKVKKIAIVGISSKEERPSNKVGSFLQEKGYEIFAVNPRETEVLGNKSYANLSDLPEIPDVVDVFRKSEEVMPILDECIKLGIKFIWLQEGIINEDAKKKALEHGINFVMSRCMLKEYKRLFNLE